MVDEFGARSVVDVGCGTGTFACALAARGIEVVGVDPAGASLDVARTKPFADRVRWIHGHATTLDGITADLATMTANVAQVFLTDDEWRATLAGIHAALRPGGRLVFETRVPELEAWRTWTRENTHATMTIAGSGEVETWCDLLGDDGPLVSFRWTNIFHEDGAVLVSDSTLRFWSKTELEALLAESGFRVDDIRDAPDRPGREFVFVASRVD